ncbi:MAG: trypsin-like peptidase domain-containing protein [Pirellulaceae bacterium]|nr:trypsin-like peptidase domain-containing protein [Pirellulaceae bacterium]
MPFKKHWLLASLLMLGSPALATEPDALMTASPASKLESTLTASNRLSPVVRAIRSVEPAVVNIQGNKTISTTVSGSNGTGKQEVNGMGTGVVIDPRGYIITNLHVVQDVTKIEVTLADGTTTEAKMLNFDPETDLALIRIQVDHLLPVIPMGSSNDVMRGETVIAIGNPFGYQHTATQGIVSALHRNIPVNGSQEYKDLIQTNADINPGNSGGPLVNIDGKVIGINVAVRVGAQGIGFAIPIDAAMEVMADLVAACNSDGVTHGLTLQTAYCEQGTEARVSEVVRTASSGNSEELHPGDIVKTIAGVKIQNRLDSELCLLGRDRGEQLDIEIERAGEKHHCTLQVKPNGATTQDRLVREAWDKLGIRLSPVTKQALQAAGEKYSGGLKVLEVRPGSDAAREKIVPGDVIVGIHNWQTPSMSALSWVLKSEEFASVPSAKFYVVRNNQTFWFAMKVSETRTR